MNIPDTLPMLMYVGSYAAKEEPGLHTCRFDPATGAISLSAQESGLQNPTFLDLDVERGKLYVLTEDTGEAGQKVGAAAVYSLDRTTGKLVMKGQAVTVGGPTCHIVLDQTRSCIIVSSYHGGMIGLLPLREDGQIGTQADVHQHSGSSIHPNQKSPHPHSAFLDRNNRFAIVSDLGLDRVFVYRLDLPNARLIPHSETQVTPGSGPRHFAFHPELDYGYVINELNSTITVFHYDSELGRLTEIETVSTLPADYEGNNACADIHISPDGQYLYGSNRGHDSIAVYRIDPSTGRLVIVEHVSVMGQHPRNFALTPDGNYVVVANRDTNNVVSFSRDAQTGRLEPTGHSLELPKPVCVKFI